jgi:subtilisin-like proprotein convertase family protein
MKAKYVLPFLSCLSLCGQVITFDFENLNQPIPDGQVVGIANVQTITLPETVAIADLNVKLTISGTGFGGFNGDLFVSLQHDAGYSVLLNRAGSRSDHPGGYSDNGLAITLDDSAAAEIHNYRLALSGNHTTTLAGGLSGTWSPDARNIDPDIVLDTDLRTAPLSAFNGLPLEGTWTLFISDLGQGGTHELESWSLEATPVPEPATWAIVSSSALLAFALLRRIPKNALHARKAFQPGTHFQDPELSGPRRKFGDVPGSSFRRRLRCSSVTDHRRYAPSSRLACTENSLPLTSPYYASDHLVKAPGETNPLNAAAGKSGSGCRTYQRRLRWSRDRQP